MRDKKNGETRHKTKKIERLDGDEKKWGDKTLYEKK